MQIMCEQNCIFSCIFIQYYFFKRIYLIHRWDSKRSKHSGHSGSESNSNENVLHTFQSFKIEPSRQMEINVIHWTNRICLRISVERFRKNDIDTYKPYPTTNKFSLLSLIFILIIETKSKSNDILINEGRPSRKNKQKKNNQKQANRA